MTDPTTIRLNATQLAALTAVAQGVSWNGNVRTMHSLAHLGLVEGCPRRLTDPGRVLTCRLHVLEA